MEMVDSPREDKAALAASAEASCLNVPIVEELPRLRCREGRRDVSRTGTCRASTLSWSGGLGKPHARDNTQGGGRKMRRAEGEERFVAGSLGHKGFLPVDDRSRRTSPSAPGRGLSEHGPRTWSKAGRRLISARPQGHLEGQAAIFSPAATRGLAPTGRAAMRSASAFPTAARCCRHGHPVRADDATALDVDVADLKRSTDRRDMAMRYVSRRDQTRAESTASPTPGCDEDPKARRSSPKSRPHIRGDVGES